MIMWHTSEQNDYIAKVSKHSYESYKCSLYKMFWIIPVKVHEKIFLRNLINNKVSEITSSTVFDYELHKLTK